MNIKKSKSVAKRNRQAEGRAERNKSVRSEIKTYIKKVNSDLAEGKVDKAKKEMGLLFSRLDKAVKKGIIPRNKSANHKSRIMKNLAASGRGKKEAQPVKS